MNNVIQILEENGFSKAESKVYLTLLKLGETKAGQIIKQTSFQSSVVHNALNTLSDKGFITYVTKGKIKHYRALSPDIIKKHLEQKQESFLSILPDLKLIQNKSKESKTYVEIFEGYKGLLNANLKLIENANPKEIIKYFALNEEVSDEKDLNFFRSLDIQRKEKNLITKGIANFSAKAFFKDYKSSEVKFAIQSIPPPMNIYQNKVLIYSLSQKPIGILIESDEISKQYHKLWDDIWKNS